jgi:hypothetical protein
LNSTSNKLESQIVWSPTPITNFTPSTFSLPAGYKPGS